MTFAVTPHFNFDGEARAALDFYRTVFGGTQAIVTYAAAGQASRAKKPDDVMWGQVASQDGFRIMAFDVQAERPYAAGQNAFFVSLRGTAADEVRQRWLALADGATVHQPLGPSAWSTLYGMLTDRFGVTWVVDLEQAA